MKIGINGFGRIGRLVARQFYLNPEYKEHFQIAAINDLGSTKDNSFFMKHDSIHGRAPFSVDHDEKNIILNGDKIATTSCKDPAEIPWKDYGVDVVFECTGIFRSKEKASLHMKGGAKKVVISAPGSKDIDKTIVMGVNHSEYDPATHNIISNASCTTNCLAPMASVLHKKFGIEKALMTTIHSYTSDQRLIDNSHSDMRRARTAALNMIPTSTGAASAVGEVIPELHGKLNGMSVRVPTADVSLTDLTAHLKTAASKEEINAALKEAAETTLKGILMVSDEPLVSSDYIGCTYSSVVDSDLTYVVEEDGKKGTLVKVCSWYDNEVGFSTRMLDLAKLISEKI